MSLSVVIPTFNCAAGLRKALESVKWAEEIIVVDMGSTDKTLEIAKKYGAKIFKKIPRDGNFDQNRLFGMKEATGDWILKLDSDEILSRNLQKEIQEFLEKDNGKFSGINLRNNIFMLGQQIRHGFVKKDSLELRLVRKGKWQYNPFRFHQQITVIGQIGFLKNPYNHYNFSTISEFILKMNRYTTIDAKYFRNKIFIFGVILAPIKTFFKLFFWQGGFLDGEVGFIVCCLYALYNLVEKIKVWEIRAL